MIYKRRATEYLCINSPLKLRVITECRSVGGNLLGVFLKRNCSFSGGLECEVLVHTQHTHSYIICSPHEGRHGNVCLPIEGDGVCILVDASRAAFILATVSI